MRRAPTDHAQPTVDASRRFAEPASAPTRAQPPAVPDRQVGELTRLRVWLSRHATADQRRILLVLAWQEDRLRKRSLQQRLRRLPAVRLNQALRGLIDVGLVCREGPWLEASAEIRRALIQAGIGVSRRFRPRALAEGKVKPRTRRAPYHKFASTNREMVGAAWPFDPTRGVGRCRQLEPLNGVGRCWEGGAA
jgi:hypothetical protein